MRFRDIAALGMVLAALALAIPTRADVVLFNSLGGATDGGPGVGTGTWDAASFNTDGNNYLLTNITLYVETETDYAGGVTAYLYTNGTGEPGPYPGTQLEPLGSYNDTDVSEAFDQPLSFSGADYALAPNTMYWIVLGGTGSQFANAKWQDAFGGTGYAANWIGIGGPGGFSWTRSQQDTVDGEFAMEVQAALVSSSSVPEPGTWLSVLTGLVAIPIALRRRLQRLELPRPDGAPARGAAARRGGRA